MENQINNTSVEEVQEQTETTEVKAKEEAKTFTQEDLDKILAKKFAQWQKKTDEAKLEAERKAKLTEAEKLAEERKEFETMKKEFEYEKLINKTSKILDSNNLPIEFADFLVGENEDATTKRIDLFKQTFNAALEVKVNERLRGNVPKTGTVTGGTVNPYDKKTYSLTKQMELEMNNPALAEQLRKSAK